jgi:serine protease Do
MDNRNDIMNNVNDNVQNSNNEQADVNNAVRNEQANAEQQINQPQEAQQSQPVQAAQQSQPQGEYSWRNPYYNSETHKTDRPVQTQQQTYSYDSQSASNLNNTQNTIQGNTYRNPYSSNGAGFTAYSGRSEYTTGSYSGQNSGYNGVGYTGQAYTSAPAAKPVKEKKKNGVSGKVLAASIAACILLSGVVGAGSAYFTSRGIMRNAGGTTYISQPSETSGEKTGSGLTYQTVPSSNSGKEDSENAIINAVNKAKDSVVEITTEAVQYYPFYGEYVAQGAGSGVIISTDGYIITCQHVIDGATSVMVTLTDGSKYQATLVGGDEQTDIAVIKIDANNLTSAVIGDSETLVVGQTAIAIGNPLGELGGTVTTGIISALDRDVTIDGRKYNLMQTNAAINPGNSGGGLFDINGDLIGIVNAKSSGSEIEGLGFSIPITKAMKIANDFISEGYVTGRLMMGIQIAEITSDTTRNEIYNNFPDLLNYITDVGVYFVEYSGEKNGEFEYGDRIVAIDGFTVTTLSDIRSVLEDYKDGDTVKVTVARLESTGRRAQSKMVDFDVTLHENKGN